MHQMEAFVSNYRCGHQRVVAAAHEDEIITAIDSYGFAFIDTDEDCPRCCQINPDKGEVPSPPTSFIYLPIPTKSGKPVNTFINYNCGHQRLATKKQDEALSAILGNHGVSILETLDDCPRCLQHPTSGPTRKPNPIRLTDVHQANPTQPCAGSHQPFFVGELTDAELEGLKRKIDKNDFDEMMHSDVFDLSTMSNRRKRSTTERIMSFSKALFEFDKLAKSKAKPSRMERAKTFFDFGRQRPKSPESGEPSKAKESKMERAQTFFVERPTPFVEQTLFVEPSPFDERPSPFEERPSPFEERPSPESGEPPKGKQSKRERIKSFSKSILGSFNIEYMRRNG
ncbi:hypothetical protein NHQ30_001068 [Ciborinia camelliae]|nr:hypothetical protein NHQ30_001068 [Ciborinia camelliae]